MGRDPKPLLRCMLFVSKHLESGLPNEGQCDIDMTGAAKGKSGTLSRARANKRHNFSASLS